MILQKQGDFGLSEALFLYFGKRVYKAKIYTKNVDIKKQVCYIS